MICPDQYKDIVPEIYWDNPSACARIIRVYKKASAEGRHHGYWAKRLERMTGLTGDPETYYDPPHFIGADGQLITE